VRCRGSRRFADEQDGSPSSTLFIHQDAFHIDGPGVAACVIRQSPADVRGRGAASWWDDLSRNVVIDPVHWRLTWLFPVMLETRGLARPKRSSRCKQNASRLTLEIGADPSMELG